MATEVKKFLNFFTPYEKTWFVSILLTSIIIAFIFPEDDVNNKSYILITGLYLADIFLNISCELLIAKQSRWNFIVSLGVEVVEIATCLILSYRFATILSTLFFWIPIDILSFIMWNKNKDRKDNSLTVVKELTKKQEIIFIILLVSGTILIGFFTSRLDIKTDLINSPTVLSIICYLDAAATIFGIANGIFIFLRYKEQWFCWYLVSVLEAAINILSGQWILLVLKLGYFINTTYGLIKWSKYIEKNKYQ